MKIKTTTILFIIVSFVNQAFPQELSYEAKSLAEKGLACIDNNDFYCAITKLEKLLGNYSSELNSVQESSVKDVLRNCYYDVSMAQAQNDNPGFKPYCLHGIELGKELGKQYDLNAFMFHYMMIAYYYTLENETQFYDWVSKFNNIKRNLSSEYLDTKGKAEIIAWANNNINKMEGLFSSAVSGSSISFSVGNLFSGISSSGNKPVISNSNSTFNNNSYNSSPQSNNTTASGKKDKNYIHITLKYSDGHPASNVEIRLQECGSFGGMGDDKAFTDSRGYAKIYNYDAYFACGIFAKGKKYKRELKNGNSYTIILR